MNMVVEIENPANRNMHYGNDRIIVKSFDVPDRLPNKILYSPMEANRIFDDIERDIYEGQKKAKPYEKTKFPMVLKITGAALGIAAITFKGKTIWKFVKNIFKK